MMGRISSHLRFDVITNDKDLDSKENERKIIYQNMVWL